MKKTLTSYCKMKQNLAFLLVFPIFFLLSGHVFHDPRNDFNPHGALSETPLPLLSIFACYGGFIFLNFYQGYRSALRICKITLLTIAISFFLMLFSILLSADGTSANDGGKTRLIVQLILPMLALSLGQLYAGDRASDEAMAKGFAFALLIIIPMQLIAKLLSQDVFLIPDVFLFSIYQNLQYVPVILVGAYQICLWSLWSDKSGFSRKMLVILTPLTSAYAVLSMSLLSIFFLFVGSLVFFIFRWRKFRDKFAAWTMLLLIVAGGCALSRNIGPFSRTGKLNVLIKPAELSSSVDTRMINYAERETVWGYYIRGIFQSGKTFALGNPRTPERKTYPSAHNYYLDVIYNFGFVSLAPILILVIWTFTLIWKNRKQIMAQPVLTGLAFVCIYFLAIDSMFKVGLRQPYSGIFEFFIWGLLLRKLDALGYKQDLIYGNNGSAQTK